jgi:hypothetical protein
VGPIVGPDVGALVLGPVVGETVVGPDVGKLVLGIVVGPAVGPGWANRRARRLKSKRMDSSSNLRIVKLLSNVVIASIQLLLFYK